MGSRRLWKTKSGQKIRIRDMTNSHLLNTIKLLERFAHNNVDALPVPMFTGEMAQFYAEREYDCLKEDPTSLLTGTIYEDLVEEGYRRKIL